MPFYFPEQEVCNIDRLNQPSNSSGGQGSSAATDERVQEGESG